MAEGAGRHHLEGNGSTMSAPILVTGAPGNVGTPLVDELLRRGVDVRVAAFHTAAARSTLPPDVASVPFDFADSYIRRVRRRGAPVPAPAPGDLRHQAHHRAGTRRGAGPRRAPRRIHFHPGRRAQPIGASPSDRATSSGQRHGLDVPTTGCWRMVLLLCLSSARERTASSRMPLSSRSPATRLG